MKQPKETPNLLTKFRVEVLNADTSIVAKIAGISAFNLGLCEKMGGLLPMSSLVRLQTFFGPDFSDFQKGKELGPQSNRRIQARLCSAVHEDANWQNFQDDLDELKELMSACETIMISVDEKSALLGRPSSVH